MKAPKQSRVITEPLGGSPLSLAVQTRRLPRGLQPPRPWTPDEWREHLNTVRSDGSPDWLKAIEPAVNPSGEAASRLRRVVREGGVVVTTGQQAGLFGGPLYTLAKAITAIRLADALEKELGMPVAPVFWGATDDADFLEASVAHVADADGLRELRIVSPPPAGTPMARAPLGDTSALLEELRRACGSAANAEYFEMARDAFHSRATIGDAFIQLLRALLEPFGMAVLDSSHASVRAAARPHLEAALKGAAAVSTASAAAATALRDEGFEPQVEDDRGLSLVFAIEKGVKRRLTIAEANAYRGKDELVPNVLLRPLIERALIPTAAYVAGPGELAYFVQTAAVARALDWRPAIGVPRWSCTILEPFAERALQRLGVKQHEVKDAHALERRLALAAMPKAVDKTWKELQARMAESVEALGAAVGKEKLLPPEVIEGLKRSLEHRLSRTSRRLVAAVKRREAGVHHDLAVAGAALYPMGNRQERVLNFVPMLARGGRELLDDMHRAAGEHAAALLGASRAEPALKR
jgi:bacillithiol biosynthesis cysteine-adding enzyme BshC